MLTFIVFSRFNFNISEMFHHAQTATPLGKDFLNPGNKYTDGLDMISFNMSLVLGAAGLPHLLVHFFTVKDAATARKSVVYSTWFIGVFFIMTIFLGFGAASFVGFERIVEANSAGNIAAPLLALTMGGEFLFAFVSAVAFATILAVVSGLVLTSASAFTHDIYGEIIKEGNITEKQQILVARMASIGVAVISILLALFAQSMNVAFLSVLALGMELLPVPIYRSSFAQYIGNASTQPERSQKCYSGYSAPSYWSCSVLMYGIRNLEWGFSQAIPSSR